MTSPPSASDPVLAPLGAINQALKAYVATLSTTGVEMAGLESTGLESSGTLPTNLRDAIGYALLSGGKRLRPILAWHCCEACGAIGERSLPAGIALELVHCFSLVHDDLPAMDDDDLRRGIPTLHKHAGEAMAILAGDAMLTLAFEVLTQRVPDPKDAVTLCAMLARGTALMIGGQVYDTLGGFEPDLSEARKVELVHRCKTAALIKASCTMGAVLAKANPAQLKAVSAFGDTLGLIFQIVDDLLDVEQPAEVVGKRTGKDAQMGKLTYPGVWGITKSREQVAALHDAAIAALEPLGPAGATLKRLCDLMTARTA